MIMELISIVLWLFIIFIIFYVFSKIRNRKLLKSVTKQNRGTKSERDLVLKLLKYGIPAQTIFHDLYLKKHNGNFSQIDLVVPKVRAKFWLGIEGGYLGRATTIPL